MAKIRRDQFGLFVSCGGYKSRPIKESKFTEGQDVKTHHYGGSCRAGVGKSPECERGEYLEEWITTGLTMNEKTEPKMEEQQIAWYKVYCSYSPMFKAYITDNDKVLAEKYQREYIWPKLVEN